MSLLEALILGLVLGLSNALHCAGMCGVFALQAASLAGGGSGALRLTVYTSGKTFTYIFLGAIAGAAGAEALADSPRLRAGLGACAGALIVIAAFNLMLGRRGASKLASRMTRWLAPLKLQAQRFGPFALGAVTGLIPCGVTALGVFEAGVSGSALSGLLVMAGLGLGTMPILFGVGLLGRLAGTRLSARGPRLAGGLLLILTGAMAIYRALLPLLQSSAEGTTCCH